MPLRAALASGTATPAIAGEDEDEDEDREREEEIPAAAALAKEERVREERTEEADGFISDSISAGVYPQHGTWPRLVEVGRVSPPASG